MSYDHVAQLLSTKKVVVLDGAFGTELKRRGADTVDHPHIWSTLALTHFPHLVLQTHLDYALAGADVITAGAFRTNRTALRKAGLEDLARPLTHLAVNLANEVKRKLYLCHGSQLCVAGNITSVEDCYSPGRSPGKAAWEEHNEKAHFLAEAGCDLILIESMPTLDEGICALRAARTTGKPVWLSFVLKSDCQPPQLLDGTEVVKLPQRLGDADALPDALLFNCSWPEAVSDALVCLRGPLSGFNVPMGAYANIERQVDTCGPWARMTEITPQSYAELALHWMRLGAQVVGGCCGTTPDDVRAIRQAAARRPPGTVGRRSSEIGVGELQR